jgi:hypothetical protein
MNKIIVALCLCLIGFGSNAQTIKGKVTEKANGEALMSANVLLINANNKKQTGGAATDVNGNYEIKNVQNGEYLVICSYSGYGSDTIKMGFGKSPEKTMTIDFALNSLSESLGTVEVTAKVKQFEQDADKLIMNVDENAAATATNAFDLLKKVPGVSIDNDENLKLNGQGGILFQFDGRDMKLPWEALKSILKGMTPDQVDKFEVISSPSAKYEAEGTAGIINIKLKKNLNYGFNGSVNAMAGLNGWTFDKDQKLDFIYHGGFNLNYVDKKWTITLGYNGMRWAGTMGQEMDIKTWVMGDTIQIFQPRKNQSWKMNNHNFNFGTDYLINDKNLIGITANYSTSRQNGSSDNTKSEYRHLYPFSLDSTSANTYDNQKGNDAFNIAANYTHKFDSITKLTMEADFGLNNSYDTSNNIAKLYRYLSFNDTTSSAYVNDALNGYNSFSYKADFEKSFGKSWLLEAGIKTRFTNVDNDFKAYTGIDIANTEDTNRSNHFLYSENINAAYVSATKKWEKFSIRAGLRGENTNWETYNQQLDSTNTNSYTNLFPNLNINYNLGEMHKLSLTYSYRISRPDYNSLNPFESKQSEYAYNSGNPFLKPQYTHKIDLNASIFYMLFLNVSYGYTKDNVLELPRFKDNNSLIMLTRPDNLAQSHNLNFNLSTYLPIGKWLTLILWGSENYWKSVSDIVGAETNISRWGFMGYGALNFNLPKDWKVTVNGFYLSGGMQGLYTYESYYTVGMSVSKDFLKKQLNVSLGCDGLLHPSKMSGGYTTNNLIANVNFYQTQRRIGITLRYNFGKMYEGERLKKIESDDMEERAKPAAQQGGAGSGVPMGK